MIGTHRLTSRRNDHAFDYRRYRCRGQASAVSNTGTRSITVTVSWLANFFTNKPLEEG